MRTKRIKKVTAALMTLVMGLMMNIQAFADTIPVIDMGTFHNVYVAPTDEWIEGGWEHEVKEEDGQEYILLKKYTGTDTDLVISGKATAEGKTCPVIIGLDYDAETGEYTSFLNGNTSVSGIGNSPYTLMYLFLANPID